MEHGLKQIVQATAAGGLIGFELADFSYPLSELLLQRQRWNGTGSFLERLAKLRSLDRLT